MKKSKVLLMGGVGNRLFQIARALSLRTDSDICEVIAIPTWIEKLSKIFGWSYHQQWLDLIDLCRTLDIKYREANFIELIYISIVYSTRRLGLKIIPFDEFLDKNSFKNFNIGYYQSPDHVKKESVYRISNRLRNMIQVEQSKRIVVHVRGGDFPEEMRTSNNDLNEVKGSEAEILYVTNDVDHARKILKDKPSVIIQRSSSDLIDFRTLCGAGEFYPANSTFSFWAAAVVKEAGGIVIIPRKNQMWQLLEN